MAENNLPVMIRALLNPASYDHPVTTIELVETHISWVLLTGTYAYKIKKPVNLGFLDFSTLEKRRFYCEEELRLNRRFSPQLYLDIIPIGGTPEQPVLNDAKTSIEYAVRMHQFPQDAILDQRIRRGLLDSDKVSEIAREVARFHAMISKIKAPEAFGTPDAIQQPVLENFAQITKQVSGRPEEKILAVLEGWSKAEFERLKKNLVARKEQGYIRECHGDLHLGNMAWIDDKVTLFDCIEFNPQLRWIDVMSDAAFVIMDLHDRKRPDLAQRFINSYLEQTGDFSGLSVLNYYCVYRAMVRAKVAIIRAGQACEQAQPSQNNWHQAEAYLKLANRFTQPRRPWLVITHGLSGSGKTTASQALLQHSGAIRLRSDIERKRLFGLSPEARSQSSLDQGLYTPEAHEMTYRRLEELSRLILGSGYPVIVDAAFLKKSERDAFHALASSLELPFLILAIQCDHDTLRKRIVMREKIGKDASEASLEVLEKQIEFAEPISTEEQASTFFLPGNATSDEARSWISTMPHPFSVELAS